MSTVEDGLVYQLGLEHLPVYDEVNDRHKKKLVHKLTNGDSLKIELITKINEAKTLDPELEHLPIMESAEIDWHRRTDWNQSNVNGLYFGSRSITYVGGLIILSGKDSDNPYLAFSSDTVKNSNSDQHLISIHFSGLEPISLIKLYRTIMRSNQ